MWFRGGLCSSRLTHAQRLSALPIRLHGSKIKFYMSEPYARVPKTWKKKVEEREHTKHKPQVALIHVGTSAETTTRRGRQTCTERLRPPPRGHIFALDPTCLKMNQLAQQKALIKLHQEAATELFPRSTWISVGSAPSELEWWPSGLKLNWASRPQLLSLVPEGLRQQRRFVREEEGGVWTKWPFKRKAFAIYFIYRFHFWRGFGVRVQRAYWYQS